MNDKKFKVIVQYNEKNRIDYIKYFPFFDVALTFSRLLFNYQDIKCITIQENN